MSVSLIPKEKKLAMVAARELKEQDAYIQEQVGEFNSDLYPIWSSKASTLFNVSGLCKLFETYGYKCSIKEEKDYFLPRYRVMVDLSEDDNGTSSTTSTSS